MAESVYINPQDQSASNNMHWASGSGSGSSAGMHMVGLLAKAMPAAATTAASTAAAAGTELLYSVEWQALSSGKSSISPQVPARHPTSALWTLGGRAVALKQRRGVSDAAFAAANLALLQKVSFVGGAGSGRASCRGCLALESCASD